MRAIHPFLIVPLALLGTTACTVGPDYVAPGAELPARFATQVSTLEHEASFDGEDAPDEAMGPDTAAGPDTAWWHALGDPQLPELIEQALGHNHDLALAETAIRRAAAGRRVASAGGRPQVGGRAEAQRFEGSSNAFGAEAALAEAGLADLEGETYSTGFSASWELDLFGGIRRRREAATARWEATIEARRGVVLSLVAEVARSYTELRGNQRRRQLAEKNVGLVRATLERIEVRHRAGLATGLDLARARAQLAATESRLPPLRLAERSAIHRLGVLTGQQPTALLDRLAHTQPLPRTPDLVHTGLPAELLRQRPDIRAAERQLAASNAEVGARIADRWPSLGLSGGVGLESGSFADLFESSSRTWTLGPSLLAPIFQGGRLKAVVDTARADHDAARIRWQQTLLRALEDVETALVAYAEEELRRRTLAVSAEESARAAELARVLWDKGLADYLPVLDAERTLTEAEDRLAASETRRVLRLVDLYTALGGGWQSVDQRLAQTSTKSPHPTPAASASVARKHLISP